MQQCALLFSQLTKVRLQSSQITIQSEYDIVRLQWVILLFQLTTEWVKWRTPSIVITIKKKNCELYCIYYNYLSKDSSIFYYTYLITFNWLICIMPSISENIKNTNFSQIHELRAKVQNFNPFSSVYVSQGILTIVVIYSFRNLNRRICIFF